MIETIINYLIDNTPYNYYFYASPKIEDCIVYNYRLSSDNGIKQQWQLELHIVGTDITEKTLQRIENMRTTINNVLITIADNRLVANVIKCAANGGGNMIDYNTHTTHQIMYFDVLVKK